MKKIVTLLVLFLPHILSAQTYTKLDSLMFENTLWPEDICNNSSRLIQKYFTENKLDSVNTILNYWEEKSGIIEPLIRFKILYAIYNDGFSEELYDENIAEYLMYLKKRKENEIRQKESDWLVTYFSFGHGVRYKTFIGHNYNLFTAKLACDLLQTKVKEGDVSYLFCHFYQYNFDNFFYELKSGRYDGTDLKYYCDNFIERKTRELEGNISLFTGTWIPKGNNKLLGNHPQLGATIGIKLNKFLLDLALAVRFLDSKNPYSIEYEGKLKTTSSFQDSYVGAECGYELLRTNHVAFNVLGGIAWDALIPVSQDNDKGQKVKRIETTNFNTAFGIRYYYNKYSSRYIGLQIRYNFVDYQTKMGSDLSGNVLSVRLSFGLLNNKNKHEIRKAFGHSY